MRKRNVFVFLMVLLSSLMFNCFADSKSKANKDTKNFRYDLECVNNGVKGTYLVKVWSYSKKKEVAAEQCKKNAVHGIIFKGYAGTNGCISQRPLASTPGVEMEHEEYFDLFFQDNGEYLKYVQVTAGTQEIIKIGKEYKVGVIVSVAKDNLRKALEEAGVIKKMGNIF